MRTGNQLDDDFYAPGIIIGIIIAILGALGCTLGFFINRNAASTEYDLCKALENKQLWEVKAESVQPDNANAQTEESKEMKAFRLVRNLALTEGKNEALKLFVELKGAYEGDTLSSVFLNKLDDITKLVKGEIENLSSQVQFPRFWLWLVSYLAGAWLVIALSATINFVGECLNEEESQFALPWGNPWTYGLLALMAPFIWLPMAIEGAVRGIMCIATIGSRRREREREEAIRQEMSRDLESTDMELSSDEIAQRQQALAARLKQVQEQQLEQAEALDHRVLAGRELAEKRIGHAHEIMPQTQERWKMVFTEHLGERTQSLRDSIETSRENLSSLGTQITQEQKTLARAQDELKRWEDGLQALKEKKSAEHVEELNRILHLQRVKAVEISDGSLRIFTDTLYANFQGNKFELGMFMVSVNLNATNTDGVMLQNFSSTHPRGATHPYGRGSSICWGAMNDPISNMIRQKEYAVAIDFMLQALQSAEGDRPTNVLEWRIAA